MALRYRPTAQRRAPKIRPGAYQPRNDPTRRIAEQHQPKIRKAFIEAFKRFKKEMPHEKIVAHIRKGDLRAAAGSANVETLNHDLRPMFDGLRDCFKASADFHSGKITQAIANARHHFRVRKAPDRFAFNLMSDDVLETLRIYQDSLIGQLTDDVRDEIYDIILAGVAANETAEDISIAIRDQIGLSDRLASAVENYRRALETLDASSLSRTLRDDASDDLVADAIASGSPLASSVIDDLVDAYTSRALDYRADMIAQTESNRASNMGLQESYRQAVADGVFPAEAVRQYWLIAMDEKVCDICEGIADDNEEGAAIGDAFTSDDGDIDAPPAHPNCRCTLEMRTNLDMVDTSSPEERYADQSEMIEA